ncbi:MAG: zinc dependent phospholipase C family protein [Hungatella sp.]
MPTTYTHYRFGNDVFKLLPATIQAQITPYRKLYDIGLHGPDLLFYYKVFSKNPINQTGFLMHRQPAAVFFQSAQSVMKTMTSPDSGLAYLYGFICHFALDSCCHPYVEDQVRSTGITHSEIEAEWDRALMVLDGYDPITYHPAQHLKSNPLSAQTIAAFFPEIGERRIAASITSMRRCCNLLVAPGHFKRKLIFTVLKLTHSYDSIHSLVINYLPNPACRDICTVLDSHYQEALPIAVRLITGYAPYLLDHQPLDPGFDRTFGEE